MAARRARKGKGKKGNMQPVIIGAVVAVAVSALCIGGFSLKSNSQRSEPTPNFRIADYRMDGSRFASSGNSYVFDGRVENIETLGNDLVVSISIPDNVDERLPLFIPGHVRSRLRVNLTRGDRFLFETSCRTGRTPEGEQVKGILVVKNVETR